MLNTYPLAKDLQVLVEIVHSGSFSAAAATLALYRAPPASECRVGHAPGMA